MAKTDKQPLLDSELELFFNAARKADVEPSADVFNAIIADAEAQLSAVETLPVVGQGSQEGGWLQSIFSAIGGWPAAASLASATVAGVWIGFTQPVQLETLSGGLVLSGDYTAADTSYALEDLAPGYLGTTLFAEDEG
ncbi:hypothetical protein [Aliiroseovarius sp. F20344]|uniref:hypothetical protein n=1 Tax=Aliiroseovarius sp. F20344 TaxID=2926414 RepID=UPI001FF2E2E2|nr:hypothetical protein [Aliiroseovarius sp. F20344]MCK0142472.1 hypothetical protein [Aliiroseovarius sp. F20344]